MNIFSKSLSADRIRICEKCKFFKKKTRTCGTPVVGGKVTYRKKEYKLCGCFMDIKSTLKFSSCPVGKWNELQMSHEDYLDVKNLLESTKHKISMDQQQMVSFYSKKYFNVNVKPSSCPPCVKNDLKRLEQIVEEYEK